MALNLHASLTFPRVQTWEAWSSIENPLVILSNFLFLTRGTKALIQLQTMNQNCFPQCWDFKHHPHCGYRTDIGKVWN